MSHNPVTQFLELLLAKQRTQIKDYVLDTLAFASRSVTIPRFSSHKAHSLLLEDKSKTFFWTDSKELEYKFKNLLLTTGLPSLKELYGCDWTTSVLLALGLDANLDLEQIHALDSLFSEEVGWNDIPYAIMITISSITGIAILILDDETEQFIISAPNGPFRTVYLLRSRILSPNAEDGDVAPTRAYKRELGSELGISKIMGVASVPETRVLNLHEMRLMNPLPTCITQTVPNGNGFQRFPLCLEHATRLMSSVHLKISQIMGADWSMKMPEEPVQEPSIPVAHTKEYRIARKLDPLVAKTNLEFDSMDLQAVRDRAETVVPRLVMKKEGALKGFKFQRGHRVLNFKREEAKTRGIINHVFIPAMLITPIQAGDLYLGELVTFSNDVTIAKYFVINSRDKLTHIVAVVVENSSSQSICRPTAIYNMETMQWKAENRSCEYFHRLLTKVTEERLEEVTALVNDHILSSSRSISSLADKFLLNYDSAESPDKVEYFLTSVNFPAHTRVDHDLSTWYNVWPNMTNEAYHKGRIDEDHDLANSFSIQCFASGSNTFLETNGNGIVMPCGLEVQGGSHAAMLHRCSFELLGYMPNDAEKQMLRDFRERRIPKPPHYAQLFPCARCFRAYPNIIMADLCNKYRCPGGETPTVSRYYCVEVK